MALQIRRGPNAQRATTLLQVGEVAWTTDTKKLYVGDGVTTGGVNILANIAGTGFVWNPTTEQLDLAGSTITGITADNVSETNGVVPRLWYRSSLGKQHASEIFTTVAGAAHTGISFSWDDVNQKLTATVTAENVDDTVASMFTSGTHTGISFTYGLTQDAANRIDAAVDPEFIQDTVNNLLTAGVHTGITFTYSDSLNALSAAVDFSNVPMGGNLSSNLVLNSRNITGTGNITATGDLTLTGVLTATSSTLPHFVSSGHSLPLQINALNAGNTPLISLNTSNGTIAAPTNLAPGDYVGGLKLGAYYNGNYKFSGGVVSKLDADANMAKVFPKSTLFILAGNNSDSQQAISYFTGSGAFVVPILQVSDVAGTLPTPAAAGMIVLDGTTFKGYNGTAWVNLN